VNPTELDAKARKVLRKKASRAAETPEQREKRNAQVREYARLNRDAIRAANATYYAANKAVLLAKDKARRAENPGRDTAKAKQWRETNPERKLAANKAWAEANPEKHRQSLLASKRKRRLAPANRVNGAMSARIRQALRGGKDGQAWERVVGYSRLDLMRHLAARMQSGMTWANYGEWHIDHIAPVVSFDLTVEGETAKCWALQNLQPLWAGDNTRKGAKLNWTPEWQRGRNNAPEAKR
jgi:hypothetical protein